MKKVCVKFPNDLVEGMDELVKAGLYNHKSILIRSGLRDLFRNSACKGGFSGLSFWEYLGKIKDEMGCGMYFLPFQVKRLKLTNIGVFDSFEADFKSGDVNMILGQDAIGKSTILRSIAYCFGIENKYSQELGRFGKTGCIEVEVYPHSNLVTAEVKEENIQNRFHNAECILLDEPFQIGAFLKQLTKLRKQIIIAPRREETIKMQNKNIIHLTDPVTAYPFLRQTDPP